MKEVKDAQAMFQFSETSLTEFVTEAIRLHQAVPGSYFFAACASLAHADAKAWTGAKRKDRREAIKDAIEHNRQFNHQAGVLGPIA